MWESHVVQNPELLTTKGVGSDTNISQANLQMRAQPQLGFRVILCLDATEKRPGLDFTEDTGRVDVTCI